MKLLTVKWRDSQMYMLQEPMQDFDVCVIESVGYLLKEDKKKIVLAGDVLGDEYRRVIAIPKENIISKKELK